MLPCVNYKGENRLQSFTLHLILFFKQSKDNTWKITMNIQVIILISNTTAFWNGIPQIMSLSNVKMEMNSSLIQTKRLIIMLFNVK